MLRSKGESVKLLLGLGVVCRSTIRHCSFDPARLLEEWRELDQGGGGREGNRDEAGGWWWNMQPPSYSSQAPGRVERESGLHGIVQAHDLRLACAAIS